MLSKVGLNQSAPLPDYENESSEVSEQKKHVISQLLAQLELASVVCLESPFFKILRKRLLIIHRILYALHWKFHEKDGDVSNSYVYKIEAHADTNEMKLFFFCFRRILRCHKYRVDSVILYQRLLNERKIIQMRPQR